VKVALHLVPLEGAVDTAAIDGHATLKAGRFGEFLALVLAHVAEYVPDVGVFLLLFLALSVSCVKPLIGALVSASSARIGPDLEIGIFLGEEVARHDAIHGCVLDVDVEVVTWHGDDDVKIQL
jgi:hypothetical protein